jgi:LysR family transcriptional regulator, hydrogen peroxide-inducible genes activator
VTLIPEMAVPSARETRGLKVVPFASPAPTREIALFMRRNTMRGDDCAALANEIRAVWTRSNLPGNAEHRPE